MEWRGLADALLRLFPDSEFVAIPPAGPLDSFTSCDVRKLVDRLQENNADRLLRRAAVEAMKGGRQRFDLVVILDDLELENVGQPGLVVDVMRRAVSKHLDALPTNDPGLRRRTAEALVNKVSFHLAKPMTESWIFGDPQGHVNAGARIGQPKLRAGIDLEEFETDDAEYAAAGGHCCAAWLALPEDKRRECRPLWLRPAERTRHPKAYMAWLCRSPNERNCTVYRESHEGARALGLLEWSEVLGPDLDKMPFLRALVEDLADGLDQEPAVGPIYTRGAPETCRFTRREAPLLRNI
ncbi:MAG: hypothetical protein H6711_16985 [Myxococcales bacterium]|nr:hypothetical protein [Myxococcales bacterium]